MLAVEFLLAQAISYIEQMALLATVATIALVLRTVFDPWDSSVKDKAKITLVTVTESTSLFEHSPSDTFAAKHQTRTYKPQWSCISILRIRCKFIPRQLSTLLRIPQMHWYHAACFIAMEVKVANVPPHWLHTHSPRIGAWAFGLDPATRKFQPYGNLPVLVI